MKREGYAKRSLLRLQLGKCFFTVKRYFKWYFGGTKYAMSRRTELYEHIAASHRTPLIRQLRNAGMWMQLNKVKNIRIALKSVNKIVIYPGETFSFWRLTGRPTRLKGYRRGMVLANGQIISGVGGGLCQLTNLIYWMTLHTPLTVTERYRHSHDVFPDSSRTQPFGSGATCVYNYVDLQIRNDTDTPYQLNVYLTDTHLAGEWRAGEACGVIYEVYEKEHRITQEFWGGYMRHNSIWRRALTAHGELIKDEFITENHAVMMYAPLLEHKKERNESYDTVGQGNKE